MTTTIQKWGNSQGIRIPKILLDTVEWGENEQIIILVDNRKNIKELFEDFEGKYEPIEMDWGEPVGEEIW